MYVHVFYGRRALGSETGGTCIAENASWVQRSQIVEGISEGGGF